jgi:hypothetical protein
MCSATGDTWASRLRRERPHLPESRKAKARPPTGGQGQNRALGGGVAGGATLSGNGGPRSDVDDAALRVLQVRERIMRHAVKVNDVSLQRLDMFLRAAVFESNFVLQTALFTGGCQFREPSRFCQGLPRLHRDTGLESGVFEFRLKVLGRRAGIGSSIHPYSFGLSHQKC